MLFGIIYQMKNFYLYVKTIVGSTLKKINLIKVKYYFLKRKENHFSKEINQNDYNHNYHSATTLFEFITQQQYLKERQALNEHILYIKRTKNSKK